MTTTYTLTQQIIDDAVELLVTSLHHIPAAEPELKADTNAMIHLLRSLTPNSGEPVAYLWAPTKKPELARLSFDRAPSVQLKALGYVSTELFTHPAPSTSQELESFRATTGCATAGEFKSALSAAAWQAPSTKPAYSYAGVTVWLGDKSITQHIARCQIDTERVSGMSLSNTAKHCLDMLSTPQQGETK